MIKYLALGDSYTIGEALPYADNFPSQLAHALTQSGKPAVLDKLIAVTGWTTDELMVAIEQQKPSSDYDLVSLLIGVNNQYRGRSVEEYRWQFYALLNMAILFAQADPKRVVVLSIPDWGLTPFNTERDTKVVSEQIDAFNAINKEITLALGCLYVDITPSTRTHAKDENHLVEDKLHYAAKEYSLWVNEIMNSLPQSSLFS